MNKHTSNEKYFQGLKNYFAEIGLPQNHKYTKSHKNNYSLYNLLCEFLCF